MRNLLIVMLALALQPALAQDLPRPDAQWQSWDVFLRRDAVNAGLTDLIFVNLLTGETQTHSTLGERFGLLGGGVIYFDRGQSQVMLALPNEAPRAHPFISLAPGDHGVDWAIAADGGRIAWAISNMLGDEQLVTRVYLADAAGADIRELLSYGPRPGLRLLPVAFSQDGTALYLDVHPEGTGELKPYRWQTGVFSLSLEDGGIQTLPGNATCLCAVGFGAGRMLRLTPSDGTGGITVEAHDLVNGGPPRRISSIAGQGYDEAGNPLLSPDGGRAVYALSQVGGFRTPGQEVLTVLVMVDFELGQQFVINNPVDALARPVRWTDDDSAILFTTDQLNGSWKISLVDGRAVQVAEGAWLGTLRDVARR